MWIAAERHVVECPKDWYGLGVAVTCRWLATATVRSERGPWHQEPGPVTGRSGSAYEELIDREIVAAKVLLSRRPPDVWVVKRPGYVEAIVATLNWAWRRTAGQPLRADVLRAC